MAQGMRLPRWGLAIWVVFAVAACDSVTATGTLQTPTLRTSTTKRRVPQVKRELASALRRKNTSSDDQSVPVSVEALLLPRKLPVKALIRWISLACVAYSFVKCRETAGVPHLKTIWELLYGRDTTMPADYRPSTADIYLSRLIASSTNELFPPLSLPSAGPLTGLLFSIFCHIASTILLPRWFTAVKVFLDYRQVAVGSGSNGIVKNPNKAAVLVHIHDENFKQQVLVDTFQSGKKNSRVICPLQWSSDSISLHSTGSNVSHFSHLSQNFFDINQGRFYVDVETGRCFDGGPSLHRSSFSDLQQLVKTGISQKEKIMADERYAPYNRPSLAIPTVGEAFVARISSPLVLVQVMGRILSCIEEGMQSLASLVFMAIEHYMNARRAIEAARQMAQEVLTNVKDTSSLKVLILRRQREQSNWIRATSGDLVPGDVFVMLQGNENVVIPVDALVLAGQSLANEAVLTGESVPQSKTPIDFAERITQDSAMCLDLDADRNSVLFSGTTLIHCSSQANQTTIQGYRYPPHNQTSGVVCLALRTGTYSSKGQLLRTLNGGARVGAISNAQSERDAMRLIAGLSAFALASCASLFIPRGDKVDKPVSTFRRIIQCTRIAFACIPSDLPLALSAVARSCSLRLRRESDVICSEPGSLLTAAYVDTVVFDKTGTLTADTQSVAKVMPKLTEGPSGVSEDFQMAQMAGCHSLVSMGASEKGRLVGDPLDQAAFRHSQWRYNEIMQCYEAPTKGNQRSKVHPTRLWQLKSFPFDPNKRISSAIVVLEDSRGSLRLLFLSKGSPDTLINLYGESEDINFRSSYENQRREFEANGYRSVALGWKGLEDTRYIEELFPDGLETSGILNARDKAASILRGGLEVDDLSFGGFVQFDASIRTSSRRVLQELQAGGIRSIMLTGDAVDAALIVAYKVRLIRRKRIAILEVSESGNLQWRFLSLGSDQNGLSKNQSGERIAFTAASLNNVLKREKAGKYSIAATGEALEAIFETTEDDQYIKELIDNLDRLSVVARATPSQKNQVVSRLRRCGRTVMMCGDGVNDVSAMKSADTAIALLNGFGEENIMNHSVDFDDERRRKKLQSRAIGSQRQTFKHNRNVHSTERRERIQAKMDKATAEIRERAASRCGTTPDSDNVEFQLGDMKDMIAANVAIIREEGRRSRSLRVGGGDAARILAAERRNGDDDSDVVDEAGTTNDIKPGEASLVAPFSCLHPSIEGVDSVLRAGIATAASALATQELISLHSLMSCYNLASLYRDGFRYGKHMSLVEIIMYTIVDQQRYLASCVARPRLPPSTDLRPPQSMFQPTAILRTVVQAAVHLIAMGIGVNYARNLEQDSTPVERFYLKLHGMQSGKLSKMLSALALSSRAVPEENDSTSEGFFRRAPFRPNHETNVVFILSILQNMLVCLANHRGKPFSLSILESRPLCQVAVGTVGLCVAMIMEIFPKINSFLQLRTMPSKRSKMVLLLIVVLDVAASHVVNLLLSSGEKTEMETASREDDQIAADMEERLLREESSQNRRNCFVAVCIFAYFVFGLIKSHNFDKGISNFDEDKGDVA